LNESVANSKAKDIYDAYQAWCKSNGYGAENKTNFFAELKSKNMFSPTGTIDGKTIPNVVKGYSLTDEYKTENIRF
jgi:putative DNA primase/helicase